MKTLLFRTRKRLRGLLALCALLQALHAAEPVAPATRTELWIPTDQIDVILKKHPKAVLLTKEQYDTLIRDAGKSKPEEDPKLAPPKELIVEGLKLEGKVEPGTTRVELRGELTLNVPADAWAQTSLAWPFHLDLRDVNADAGVLAWQTNEEFKAENLPPENMRRLHLAARGSGRRVLRFSGSLPLYYRLRSGERGLDLQHLGCGGSLTLELPAGAEPLPGSAFTRAGQRLTAAFDHRFTRRSDNGDPLTSVPQEKKTAGASLPDAVRLRWIESPGTLPQEALRFEAGGGSARFDAADSALYTRLEFQTHVRSSTQGRHEAVWQVLGGADVQVSEVSGPDVLSWHQDGDKLHVTLLQSSALASVAVQLSRGITLEGTMDVTLPSLRVPVLLPASFTVHEGIDLLALDGVADAGNASWTRLDRDPPKMKLRIAKPRLESDVDVLARIDKDSVRVERKIVLRSDRPVTEIKLILPAEEEFIAILSTPVGGGAAASISNAGTINIGNSAAQMVAVPNISNSDAERIITPNIINQPVFSKREVTSNFVSNNAAPSPFRLTWRRVGQTIAILPAQPVSPANTLEFSVTSRLKLAKAWNGPRNPETITIRHLDIPDAVKVAGYTALDFDDAWRVALKNVSGLEDRDARLTPVKGRMAWFGLREHALTVEVERAEAVFSAEVTAYALPRARSVEIEGQFVLDISGAPLRSFQVKLPVESAKLLRVTSPLIGEQVLDDKTGTWTLNLRQESKGRQTIRWRLSLPATVPAQAAPGAADAPEAITAALPRVELPQARRFTGTWVIEANTDTQLSTQAQGMQPLDVLRAPAVAGYAPRHRVTSAFTHGSAASALTLTARRHAHSELATLVVTQMQLSSVLGADGHGLHEAHLTLTHSGEQFVRLNLPAGAELLSTLANRQAVKPVRTTGDAIAIPLPAGSANEPATTVTVQFRLGTTPWTANGEIALTPVTLAKEVPVLSTTWNVHTPGRFAFDKVQTTLEQSWFVETPGIMPRTFSMLGHLAESILPKAGATSVAQHEAKTVDFLPGGPPTTTRPSVSGLANREIARRYARIDDAKAAIERGDDTFRAGDYDGSLAAYKAAVSSIPDSPQTKDWLDYANLKFADCAVVVAKERAKAGKHDEARQLLNEALGALPQHQNARKLLDNLNDPDRWPPALTQQQIEESQKAQKGLLLANSSVELGNYDDGIRQYQDVLRVDPYSSAARRGLEEAEKKRTEYFRAAADHQRAKMLAEVDEKWEEKKPTTATPLATNGPTNRSAGAYLTAKMDRIIFPTVQFQNATVEEAVEYLRVKSRDLDTIEADPSRKGINIVLRSGDAPTGASVSLDLKNVPFSEALRYVTDLSQMKYKVESNAVVIVLITDNNSEMFTQSFRVAGNALQGGDVRGFLAQQGITMPDGSAATYQSETRSLVVRNTQPNLDLVESLVSGLNSGMPLPPPAAAAPADPFAAAPLRGSRLHASTDEMLFDPGKSGLIPLDIVIPATGRLLRFQGHQAPETLVLRYRSWERQVLWASLAMLAGMLLFARCVWRRPWIATLFVIVVAAWGFPLVLEGQWLAYANAAVFGWLAALALRVLMSVMAFGNRLRAKLAATTVNGEEVAA